MAVRVLRRVASLLQAVLAWRIKDIDVECVLDGFCVLRDMGQNVQDFAWLDVHDLAFLLADPELQFARDCERAKSETISCE